MKEKPVRLQWPTTRFVTAAVIGAVGRDRANGKRATSLPFLGRWRLRLTRGQLCQPWPIAALYGTGGVQSASEFSIGHVCARQSLGNKLRPQKQFKKNWGEQSNAYSLFFFCANVIFSCSTLETLFYPEIVANQLSFWKKWPLYMFTFWHTTAAFLNTATQIRSVQKRDSPGNLLIWPDSDESRTFSRTRQPSGENECHFSS